MRIPRTGFLHSLHEEFYIYYAKQLHNYKKFGETDLQQHLEGSWLGACIMSADFNFLNFQAKSAYNCPCFHSTWLLSSVVWSFITTWESQLVDVSLSVRTGCSCLVHCTGALGLVQYWVALPSHAQITVYNLYKLSFLPHSFSYLFTFCKE